MLSLGSECDVSGGDLRHCVECRLPDNAFPSKDHRLEHVTVLRQRDVHSACGHLVPADERPAIGAGIGVMQGMLATVLVNEKQDGLCQPARRRQVPGLTTAKLEVPFHDEIAVLDQFVVMMKDRNEPDGQQIAGQDVVDGRMEYMMRDIADTSPQYDPCSHGGEKADGGSCPRQPGRLPAPE